MKKLLILLLIIYFVSNYFIFEVRPLDVVNYQSEYLSKYIIIKAIFLFLCGLVATYILIDKRGFEKYIFKNAIKFLLLFNFWAFISVIWSLNRNITLYRAVEFLVGVVLMYLICIEIKNEKELYKSLITILTIAIIIYISNVINLALNSDININSQYFRENLIRSNSGSMVGGVLAIIGLTKLIEYKKGFAIFLSGIFILVAFRSSASFIIFLFGIIFIIIKDIRKALFLGVIFFILSLLFLDKLIELILFFDPEKNYEKISNLTGRTILWEGALSLITSKFLLGYGYGTSRELFLNVASWSAANAHNGYLSSIIELGIVGLVITTMIIIITINNVRWMLKNNPIIGRMFSAILFIILTNNLTIAGVGSQANISWAILFFILFSTVTIKLKYYNKLLK